MGIKKFFFGEEKMPIDKNNTNFYMRIAPKGKRYIVQFMPDSDTIGYVVTSEDDRFPVGHISDKWPSKRDESIFKNLPSSEFPKCEKRLQVIIRDDEGNILLCPFLFGSEFDAMKYCEKKKWMVLKIYKEFEL